MGFGEIQRFLKLKRSVFCQGRGVIEHFYSRGSRRLVDFVGGVSGTTRATMLESDQIVLVCFLMVTIALMPVAYLYIRRRDMMLAERREPGVPPRLLKHFRVTLSPENPHVEKDTTCVCCMSDLTTAELKAGTLAKLPCGHYFHSACVLQWLSKKRTCPMCVQDVVEGLDAKRRVPPWCPPLHGPLPVSTRVDDDSEAASTTIDVQPFASPPPPPPPSRPVAMHIDLDSPPFPGATGSGSDGGPIVEGAASSMAQATTRPHEPSVTTLTIADEDSECQGTESSVRQQATTCTMS